MAPGKEIEMLASEEIEAIVERINTQKDEEASQRRSGRGTGAAASGTGQGGEQVLAARPAGEGGAAE